MVEDKDLDLIICHLCRLPFNDDESAYTITASTFNKAFTCFDPQFRFIPNDGTPIDVKREIAYHEKCFTIVAGENLMP